MNKTETIISVMEAFDEIERLKAENKELNRRQTVATLRAEGLQYTIDQAENDIPRWFDAIYSYGRRALWEKYGRGSWYSSSVDVTTNDDGTKSVETFEHWYKDNYEKFPDFMSREDFLQEFEPELRDRYQEQRDEALKED